MPRIDYNAIREKIGEVILRDPDLQTLIIKKDDVNLSDVFDPSLLIEFISRSPTSAQVISAGQKIRYEINATLVLFCCALNIESAIQIRDDFISKIEYALLSNRRLDNTVNTTVINGGDLMSGAKPGSGYHIAGGEINLTIDVDLSV